MTTDGRISHFKAAKKGDAWEITGPCIVRVVNGPCRLQIEIEDSTRVKDLDKPEIPGYDENDKQPTETA